MILMLTSPGPSAIIVWQDGVGVYEPSSRLFYSVPLSGDAARGLKKYAGAAALGRIVYFAPFYQVSQ